MQLLAVLICLAKVMSVDTKATRTLSRQGITYSVAHVSFVGYLVTVLQIQRTALQQSPFSPGILWLRCLPRLNVTVGCANVRTSVTIGSVCFVNVPIDNVHPFPQWADLRSLYTCREPDVFPCVRDAITMMFTTSTL